MKTCVSDDKQQQIMSGSHHIKLLVKHCNKLHLFKKKKKKVDVHLILPKAHLFKSNLLKAWMGPNESVNNGASGQTGAPHPLSLSVLCPLFLP